MAINFVLVIIINKISLIVIKNAEDDKGHKKHNKLGNKVLKVSDLLRIHSYNLSDRS